MATQQFSNHALYVYKGVLSKRVSLLNLKYLIALVFHAPFTGFKYCFHSGKLSVIGTDKKIFLCLLSSGLELMTLTQSQRKIFLSVPIHG